MSDNPNFNPTYSTWDIWRAGEIKEQHQAWRDEINQLEENLSNQKNLFKIKIINNNKVKKYLIIKL